MGYVEDVKIFLLKSKEYVAEEIEDLKKETGISDEEKLKEKHTYPYGHMLGHIEIADKIIEKIDGGMGKINLRRFIESERAKALKYIDECDNSRDLNYHIADGIACELNEKKFLKERN